MLVLLLLLQQAFVSPDYLMMQGRAALKEARYADAEQFLTQLIDNAEKSNVGDTQLAVAYNDLAETYRRTGRYAESKLLFDKSLILLRKNTKPGRELVTVLNNAGVAYLDTGQYAQSSALLEEAQKIA